MSKKYWIDKQRNASPVIAYGVAGNYQTLTLQHTLRHLNKKDKQIAELMAENKALREAADNMKEALEQYGVNDLGFPVSCAYNILCQALEVDDE